METIGGVLAAILLIGFFGGLMYVCLFKAEVSNYPTATRGIGLCMLAGAIKVLFLILGESASPVFKAEWLNYPLLALFVVGMFMMMSGFGGDSK